MTAVVIGLLFIVLGAAGLAHWPQDFLVVVRGFGPLSILIGGLVSLIAGIASFRQGRADDRNKN